MSVILSVRNLTKNYKQRKVVNNVSFDVEKGNVYGVLGPNGSGKSTIFGMLLTIINPTSGEWYWFENKGTSKEAFKKIGAIIGQPNFYPYLSAERNLKIVAEIKGVDYSRIDEVLSIVGLLDRKKDMYKTYSLGMKQRLAIASALLNTPEVLVLDEPTNGLDPEGIIQIREIISDISKKGTTIIIASHLLDEIEKVCTHTIVLKNGNVLYCGRVDEMIASKGYFELKLEDNELLVEILREMQLFYRVELKEDIVVAYPSSDMETSYLNKMLVERGIYLSHLVMKKQSLETQFLELIKK